jgi:hypothetical protein
MADHLREQILDAIVTKLTGLATTGANVDRLRVYAHDPADLPSLNIKQGDEEIIEDGVYDYVDRELTVNIEIREQSSSVQLDQTLNLISKEVTIALAADITQGITGLINSSEVGTSEPEPADGEETNKPTALMIMTWLFYYRTTRADPSAAS